MKTGKKMVHHVCIAVGIIACSICGLGASLIDVSEYRILLVPSIIATIATTVGLIVKKSSRRMCGTYETLVWLSSVVMTIGLLVLT